nr:hypothetical protein [uncultured Kingella sp.]
MLPARSASFEGSLKRANGEYPPCEPALCVSIFANTKQRQPENAPNRFQAALEWVGCRQLFESKDGAVLD